MQQFQTLLLDVDNTLLDFNAGERIALEQAFVKHGYSLNEEIRSTYDRINVGLWKQYEQGLMDRKTVIYSRFGLLFKEIGIENDGVLFEDVYQDLLGQQHIFIPDALEVVEYLYSKYDLYIVTNGVTATQMRRLKESGLDRYMKQIIVSEATGYQKPMKEYFDYCIRLIPNFEAEKAMIIGDSLSSDIKGGNNAGIKTCWYNPLQLKNETDSKVDYEIQSLPQLYDLL
ncbi:MAG: noncanonical pyrimidine nucleotidase, YjjG family [Herbinix sp.]|nr:noncanonical pyrimidine nucleotidase, YjjG family [Herbinix sp.]